MSSDLMNLALRTGRSADQSPRKRSRMFRYTRSGLEPVLKPSGREDHARLLEHVPDSTGTGPAVITEANIVKMCQYQPRRCRGQNPASTRRRGHKRDVA